MAYVRYDIYGWRTDVLQLGIIGIIGSLVPLCVIALVKTQGESFHMSAKKIESNDFMLLAFIGSYLLPLISKATDLSVNGVTFILAILGIVMWLTASIPVHPLLRAFRFRFYKIESSSGMVYTLITRREIRDPREIRAVKKLSETMIMEDENA